MPGTQEKVVLVTGATNGIGRETAVALARMGARVAIVGRDPDRTRVALADIRTRAGSEAVESLLCDFSSQARVRQLATDFRQRYGRLDVLVNNAGTFLQKRTLTEDGLETTFAVNHLGYFLLTHLLGDLLPAGSGRVVNVASDAHRGQTLDLDDLGLERGYSLWRAYGRSKLANILFTRELARRWADRGITANALHPGVVATGLWNNSPTLLKPLVNGLGRLFFRSPEAGARTIIHLAASPAVAGQTGAYFKDEKPVRPSRAARDDAMALALWEKSVKLCRLE